LYAAQSLIQQKPTASFTKAPNFYAGLFGFDDKIVSRKYIQVDQDIQIHESKSGERHSQTYPCDHGRWPAYRLSHRNVNDRHAFNSQWNLPRSGPHLLCDQRVLLIKRPERQTGLYRMGKKNNIDVRLLDGSLSTVLSSAS
jgi:hypothetical protein